METIKYESDENARGTTVCPYVESKERIPSPIYVGSMGCWKCLYLKKVDLKNSFVICKYKEENGIE